MELSAIGLDIISKYCYKINMEKNVIYLPIGYRLFSILLEVILLLCAIFFIIKHEYFITALFLFGFLFFFFFIILTFVHYMFSEEKISVKIPFFKTKECNLNEIIGFNLFAMNSNTVFFVYTAEKHLAIRYDGKKIKNEIKNFIEKYYEIIKEKNISELRKNGVIVKISKNKYYCFFENHLKINNKGNEEIIYYKNLVANYLGLNNIYLSTSDKRKIEFNLHQCRGNIGLFEHLLKYKWQ